MLNQDGETGEGCVTWNMAKRMSWIQLQVRSVSVSFDSNTHLLRVLRPVWIFDPLLISMLSHLNILPHFLLPLCSHLSEWDAIHSVLLSRCFQNSCYSFFWLHVQTQNISESRDWLLANRWCPPEFTPESNPTTVTPHPECGGVTWLPICCHCSQQPFPMEHLDRSLQRQVTEWYCPTHTAQWLTAQNKTSVHDRPRSTSPPLCFPLPSLPHSFILTTDIGLSSLPDEWTSGCVLSPPTNSVLGYPQQGLPHFL